MKARKPIVGIVCYYDQFHAVVMRSRIGSIGSWSACDAIVYQDPASQTVEEARHAEQDGHWTRALMLWVGIAGQAPEDVDVQIAIGRCALKIEDPDRATTAFLSAISLCSSHPAAWAGLSEAHEASGDLEGAIAAREAELEFDPANIQCQLKLAELHAKRTDYANAGSVIARLIANPNNTSKITIDAERLSVALCKNIG